MAHPAYPAWATITRGTNRRLRPVSKLRVDPPVARFIGIRQGGAANRFAKARVIELAVRVKVVAARFS